MTQETFDIILKEIKEFAVNKHVDLTLYFRNGREQSIIIQNIRWARNGVLSLSMRECDMMISIDSIDAVSYYDY